MAIECIETHYARALIHPASVLTVLVVGNTRDGANELGIEGPRAGGVVPCGWAPVTVYLIVVIVELFFSAFCL